MSAPAPNEDFILLSRYAGERSQAAFGELVRRHLNLVYNCALWRVGGDAHLAKDVAQQVFVALARQADSLGSGTVLPAWLYTCTRHAAAHVVRTERRRRIREDQAQFMNATASDANPEPDWEKLRPVLQETIDELGERDREAVVLRFFEGRSFSEVGSHLRLTENAARMRVERALDKLHGLLSRRGIPSTSAAVALALGGHVMAAAAPAGLAATVTTAALAGSSVVAGGGALVSFMSTIKLQLSAVAVVGFTGGAAFVAESRHQDALREELSTLRSTSGAVASLQDEQQRLRAQAADVADLRRDDAALSTLRDEIAGLQSARADRVRAAAAASASRLPADASGTVFDIKQLDQQPTPRRQVPPVYPTELRTQGITGQVVVDFVVDAEGKVQQAYAKRSSNPGLEESAVKAVSQWQFDPGKKGGLRVNTHLQIPIVFTIAKENIKLEPWF